MLSNEEKARWAQDVVKADIVNSARAVTSAIKCKPLDIDEFKSRVAFLEERNKELRDLDTEMIATMDQDEMTMLEVTQTEKFERAVSLRIRKAHCAIRRATSKPVDVPDIDFTKPPPSKE